MIRLEEITPNNWRLGLEVAEDQKNFVSNETKILARAYAYRNFRSNAFIIYNGDTPVGMALYYDCEPLNSYDFSQLLIDKRYQGKGYGKEAARLIIDRMIKDGRYDKIVLCIIEGNERAKKLYEALGFTLTGDRDGDEIIMEKALR